MIHRSCLRLLAAASAAGCLLGLSAPAQATPKTYHNSYAMTFGCDPVTDRPPESWDFSPTKGDRRGFSSVARAPSGSRARAAGAIILGRLPALHLKALAAPIPPGCFSSAAEAKAITYFTDEIDVTAGDLPVGTPVTYTATLDLVVDMERPGNGCETWPTLRGYLALSGPFATWTPIPPFHGTHRLTVAKTAAVGDRLALSAEVRSQVNAMRSTGSNTWCSDNMVRMPDAGRITLTTDVPGANTTSISGIRYGLPR